MIKRETRSLDDGSNGLREGSKAEVFGFKVLRQRFWG